MALYGAICLIALVLVGPSRATENDPYPIWWSEKLRLESLEQIEARLEEPFWDNGGYSVSKGRGDARTETMVDNCNTRRRLFEEGYSAEAPEQYFEVYLWAVCDALEKLATAKPADRSFVRNFVFDRNALDLLPAIVGGAESCGFLCRLKWANERGDTWTQLADELFKQHARENLSMSISGQTRSTIVEDDKTATILFEYVEEVPVEETKTTIWSYSVDRNPLEILAYGDFNEDGLEDMMMRRQGARSVYLLTRDTPDGVFYTLNVGEHLCPDYSGCR
jgi:hypothetical protein